MGDKSIGGDFQNKKFLVVAGNIGSGKTTLTRKLSEDLNLKPFFEPVVNNPFLEDFYHDMNRWSFSLQIYFLNHRFNAHKLIEGSKESGVQDRSIYEDAHVFARSLFEQGNMDARDYECYLGIYHSMLSFLNRPNLVIYLKRSVPKLIERIRKRGRDYEQGIAPDYLERLNQYYNEWFESYQEGPKLVIDTDDLDFVRSQDDYNFIKNKIIGALGSEREEGLTSGKALGL